MRFRSCYAKLDHAFIAENAERIDAERQQLAEAEAEQKRAERVSSKEQMLSQIAKLIPVYERECRERTERAKLPPDYETHTNIPDPENLKIICTNLENLRKMESLWERYNPDIECSFLTVNYMADIHYPGNECQVGTDEAGIENVDL
jgi:hypothetical protein